MIRIPITKEKLSSLIEAESPGWSARAKKRQTQANKNLRVGEGEGIWSDVKGVYMTLQGFKCMYCEKPMPESDHQGGASGKVEYDVEHFRPKNRVTAWPSLEVKKRRRIDYDGRLRAGFAKGYVWLAFDPLNYGVSCKTCNSELKGDRFPILGDSGAKGDTIEELNEGEIPCLILPVGDNGPDPESFFEWTGPLVRPKTGLSQNDKMRAKVLIDFFELDSRRDLITARCNGILLLYPQLKEKTERAKKFIAALSAVDAPFAGCFRAFVQLYRANPKEAAEWVDRCTEYLVTRGRAGLPK